jgi:hypothetical protein
MLTFVISWSVYPWQAFTPYSNKHSSLVQKFINYGRKFFLSLTPAEHFHGILESCVRMLANVLSPML